MSRRTSSHQLGGHTQAFRCNLTSPWRAAMAPQDGHFDHPDAQAGRCADAHRNSMGNLAIGPKRK